MLALSSQAVQSLVGGTQNPARLGPNLKKNREETTDGGLAHTEACQPTQGNCPFGKSLSLDLTALLKMLTHFLWVFSALSFVSCSQLFIISSPCFTCGLSCLLSCQATSYFHTRVQERMETFSSESPLPPGGRRWLSSKDFSS